MTSTPIGRKAPSFDLAPEDFRRLGHQLIDLMAEALEREPEDPVLRPTTGEEVHALLAAPLPRQGQPAGDVLREAADLFHRHGRRNGHPRFFGYVCGSADPVGALADALASLLNQNVTAWRSAPAAAEMERQVVRWLDEFVGFAGGGHGLLVSGGSAANANAMACAVHHTLERAGIDPADRRRLRVYLSQETHVSVRKAAGSLGLGGEQLRMLGVDGRRRLIPHEVDRALTEDLAAGLLPACICASAGTANTGAIDPLEDLADLAERTGVWFHIDGAYGAPAAATAGYHHLRRTFARADSLSLDPHKWLFAPIDVGCILVRDPAAPIQTFSQSTEYIAVTQTAPREAHAFFDHGTELTRRLRALKVWAILKTRGADQLAAVIDHNIELRRHLDRRVAEHPHLEGLGSELSISCFRHVPPGTLDANTLNEHNRRILEALVHEGRLLMSPTTLDGRYSLRVCITNFRTTREDIDLLVNEVLRLASTQETIP